MTYWNLNNNDTLASEIKWGKKDLTTELLTTGEGMGAECSLWGERWEWTRGNDRKLQQIARLELFHPCLTLSSHWKPRIPSWIDLLQPTRQVYSTLWSSWDSSLDKKQVRARQRFKAKTTTCILLEETARPIKSCQPHSQTMALLTLASKERGSLTCSRRRPTTIKKRQRILLFQALPCLLASLKALMLNSFNAEYLPLLKITEITFHQFGLKWYDLLSCSVESCLYILSAFHRVAFHQMSGVREHYWHRRCS